MVEERNPQLSLQGIHPLLGRLGPGSGRYGAGWLVGRVNRSTGHCVNRPVKCCEYHSPPRRQNPPPSKTHKHFFFSSSSLPIACL